MKGPIIATSASATTEIELVSHEEQGLTSEARAYPPLSRWKSFTIIATVTGITILNSMQNGIVTVGLPIIGRDLHLSESLILWFCPSRCHLLVDTLGPPQFILLHVAVSSFSQDN